MLHCKGVIADAPIIQSHYWRAGKLCDARGIKKPTLSGSRRRGWVQVRQVGSRWIYWADAPELERLRKLAAHPAGGSTPTPADLTAPASRMPRNEAIIYDEQWKQGNVNKRSRCQFVIDNSLFY
jgi:hypothetical protein